VEVSAPNIKHHQEMRALRVALYSKRTPAFGWLRLFGSLWSWPGLASCFMKTGCNFEAIACGLTAGWLQRRRWQSVALLLLATTWFYSAHYRSNCMEVFI